jgi:hypothetical protein
MLEASEVLHNHFYPLCLSVSLLTSCCARLWPQGLANGVCITRARNPRRPWGQGCTGRFVRVSYRTRSERSDFWA